MGLLGGIPWNKGKKGLYHWSDKTRKKTILALTGRVVSKITRDKIGAANKIAPHPFGSNHPMFGKHHSSMAIEKMRKARLGVEPANKGKKASVQLVEINRLSHLGIRHTEEQKRVMSQIAKKKGYGKWMVGKKSSLITRIKLKNIARRGEKNNKWKGGITPENTKIRHSIEYSLWRESVFARDNWTCQKTKIKGGGLHAHHLQNFSQYPELRFAIDNGVTFSQESHKLFHKLYGKQNNTKEQVIEFINS